MMIPNQFLIDGIDRLGKSTLVDNIIKRFGYYLVVHSGKPLPLSCYMGSDNEKKKQYQYDCIHNIFGLVSSNCKLIFDRTHLGEMVYAPLYRDYDGSYVFDSESMADTTHAKLVLLTTSNFNILQDDGESFNWNNKEKEQKMFIAAFTRSTIKDRVLVDVHDGSGGYKSSQMILDEVLKGTKKSMYKLF